MEGNSDKLNTMENEKLAIETINKRIDDVHKRIEDIQKTLDRIENSIQNLKFQTGKIAGIIAFLVSVIGIGVGYAIRMLIGGF